MTLLELAAFALVVAVAAGVVSATAVAPAVARPAKAIHLLALVAALGLFVAVLVV